jgi:deoxyribose-phosphate aldolase
MLTKYDRFVNENQDFIKTSEGKLFVQHIIEFLSEKHSKSLEEAKKLVEDNLDEINDYFMIGISAKGVARKLFQETEERVTVDELTESLKDEMTPKSKKEIIKNISDENKEKTVRCVYNRMIDYTQLDPNATKEDILELTEKARIIEPASICILPKMVKFGKENLKDTDIMVCTVISFPGGNNTPEEKLSETKQAILDGADEVDMVLDYQLLKQKWDGVRVDKETDTYLRKDISQLANLCHRNNVTLKVIVESGLLDIPQTEYCTNLCLECGADYIKTSTGKVAVGAELDKVKAMKDTIAAFGGTMFIKASGGIRTMEDIKKYLPYVDRFGIGWGAVDTLNGLSKETKTNY